MTQNPRDRFFGMMTVIIMVGGLLWLGLALFNMRQGGSFNWTGLGVFLVIIAGFSIARSRGRRSE